MRTCFFSLVKFSIFEEIYLPVIIEVEKYDIITLIPKENTNVIKTDSFIFSKSISKKLRFK